MLKGCDILELDDRKVEELFIPEWDKTVRIAEVSADIRDELEQYLAEQATSKGYKHIRGVMAAASLVDENNDHLFKISDADKLGKKNAMALDRIFEVANRLNKIFGAEKEQIKKK